MYYVFVTLALWNTILTTVKCKDCDIKCPPAGEEIECGFNAKEKSYKMFPSNCALVAYSKCHNIEYIRVPIHYCIKNQLTKSRRFYGESCPVFCPNHYRPVCGASKLRDYVYKTFNNACYLDMLNCRGDEDVSGGSGDGGRHPSRRARTGESWGAECRIGTWNDTSRCHWSSAKNIL